MIAVEIHPDVRPHFGDVGREDTCDSCYSRYLLTKDDVSVGTWQRPSKTEDGFVYWRWTCPNCGQTSSFRQKLVSPLKEVPKIKEEPKRSRFSGVIFWLAIVIAILATVGSVFL